MQLLFVYKRKLKDSARYNWRIRYRKKSHLLFLLFWLVPLRVRICFYQERHNFVSHGLVVHWYQHIVLKQEGQASACSGGSDLLGCCQCCVTFGCAFGWAGVAGGISFLGGRDKYIRLSEKMKNESVYVAQCRKISTFNRLTNKIMTYQPVRRCMGSSFGPVLFDWCTRENYI